MPPHPKKKRTSSRKGGIQSHFQRTPIGLVTCAQCRNAKPPHTVCPTCGYYAGREVVVTTQVEPGQETA